MQEMYEAESVAYHSFYVNSESKSSNLICTMINRASEMYSVTFINEGKK